MIRLILGFCLLYNIHEMLCSPYFVCCIFSSVFLFLIIVTFMRRNKDVYIISILVYYIIIYSDIVLNRRTFGNVALYDLAIQFFIIFKL